MPVTEKDDLEIKVRCLPMDDSCKGYSFRYLSFKWPGEKDSDTIDFPTARYTVLMIFFSEDCIGWALDPSWPEEKINETLTEVQECYNNSLLVAPEDPVRTQPIVVYFYNTDVHLESHKTHVINTMLGMGLQVLEHAIEGEDGEK